MNIVKNYMILLASLTIANVAYGDHSGFGSSFGGAMVGSTFGSMLGNAMTRPRERGTYDNYNPYIQKRLRQKEAQIKRLERRLEKAKTENEKSILRKDIKEIERSIDDLVASA